MTFTLKSLEFRREREKSWRDLDRLVRHVESNGIRSLDAKESTRLPGLYRAAVSSLSVARAISLDQAVVNYLENLTARAYLVVYGPRRGLLWGLVDFFVHRFPDAVRRYRRHVAFSVGVLLLGMVIGWHLVDRDPSKFHVFVPAELAGGRTPDATDEVLREALFTEEFSLDQLIAFASQLFTHNSRVGMNCFVFGFAFGLPTFLLLLYTGGMLGAFTWLYASRGMTFDLYSWLLVHGITEIGAICLCGAAGFVVAQSIIFPGRYRRLENLAREGRRATWIVLGCLLLFFVAGILEGIFRQTVRSVPLRYGIAAVTAIFWAWYFICVGRGRRA